MNAAEPISEYKILKIISPIDKQVSCEEQSKALARQTFGILNKAGNDFKDLKLQTRKALLRSVLLITKLNKEQTADFQTILNEIVASLWEIIGYLLLFYELSIIRFEEYLELRANSENLIYDLKILTKTQYL